MNVPFADLISQYNEIKNEIDSAIELCIQDSSFIGGPQVGMFEDMFCDLVGASNCISCANGTDALYIAMRGLGIKQGDEVITTAHSWFSTSEAISQAGGKPIFCDTQKGGFCIDPDLLPEKITERTVGIVPVHLYGHPADMNKIVSIAKEYSLWVVEDCAQAHLSRIGNQVVGTFGDAATFSFYPGKNLGAMGDAGAIITDNQALAEWCQLFSKHGGKGRHLMEGINSRMDSIQAAILNVKMPHLLSWTQKRVEAAAYYTELLSGLSSISTPAVLDGAYHVFHLYTILCEDRNALKDYLKINGIDTNINYPLALPFLPAYSGRLHRQEDFPQAFHNQSRILSLPIHPDITREQQEYVADRILKFYNQ